jgi:hypothetical protein
MLETNNVRPAQPTLTAAAAALLVQQLLLQLVMQSNWLRSRVTMHAAPLLLGRRRLLAPLAE